MMCTTNKSSRQFISRGALTIRFLFIFLSFPKSDVQGRPSSRPAPHPAAIGTFQYAHMGRLHNIRDSKQIKVEKTRYIYWSTDI